MTELPAFIYAIHFEGAPLTARATVEEVREYLADVFEEDADSYQVWALDTVGETSSDRTQAFCEEWANGLDFGSGDEPDEILKPFPGFVLAHIREGLIETYRSAQDGADSARFETTKLHKL